MQRCSPLTDNSQKKAPNESGHFFAKSQQITLLQLQPLALRRLHPQLLP